MPGKNPFPESGATPAQLVTALLLLKKGRVAIDEDIEQIEKSLIDLGPGTYVGLEKGEVATVFAAAPSTPGKVGYELKNVDEEKARALAGPSFAKLFQKVPAFIPVEGFTAVAHALLTPAKERDLVALCQKIGKGYAGRAAYVTCK